MYTFFGQDLIPPDPAGLWINQVFNPSTWLFEVYHVYVSFITMAPTNPNGTHLRFQRAAEAMSFSFIEDTSSPDAPCDGLSSLDSTVDKDRQRVSTMEAYLPLRTALARQASLTLCTGATVCRIDGSHHETGYRANRVVFQKANRGNNKVFSVKVKKEVVVSSGALGSPEILMLRFVPSLNNNNIALTNMEN